MDLHDTVCQVSEALSAAEKNEWVGPSTIELYITAVLYKCADILNLRHLII